MLHACLAMSRAMQYHLPTGLAQINVTILNIYPSSLHDEKNFLGFYLALRVPDTTTGITEAGLLSPIYTVFQKKTSTYIIGYKLRNSCLILITFDSKIPHII